MQSARASCTTPQDLSSSCVTVFIPARNEAPTIAACLDSLERQTRPPGRVVVVVNNTTDDTAAVARAAGATVLVMEHNPHKKAGALNYGLDTLASELDEDAMILVMDADTTLCPDFIEVALDEMRANKHVGGVSSIFVGRESNSLLGWMQQMEYFRYKREIRRHGNRAFVLSGTASLIRWSALQQIKQERLRGEQLPYGGSYYDTASLTEDNELTLALLSLGWLCPAPGSTSTTDVMETLASLMRQRRRWYLGALQNIWGYGRKLPWAQRWLYWRQQIGLAFSVVFVSIVLLTNGYLILTGSISLGWFFVIATGVLVCERTMTVWKMGARYRTVALLCLPELAYTLLLLAFYLLAVNDLVRGKSGTWHAT